MISLSIQIIWVIRLIIIFSYIYRSIVIKIKPIIIFIRIRIVKEKWLYIIWDQVIIFIRIRSIVSIFIQTGENTIPIPDTGIYIPVGETVFVIIIIDSVNDLRKIVIKLW